jgi:hypothetical protein
MPESHINTIDFGNSEGKVSNSINLPKKEAGW